MLFNSYEFLFAFLPIVLILYFTLAKYSETLQLLVLLMGSACFYAWWDIRFCLLLGSSILINYVLGLRLAAAVASAHAARSRRLLTLGVAFNLAVLGTFKYAYFFVSNVNAFIGTDFTLGTIILPLGISFFTFEQIGYLIDIRRGSDYKADLLRYSVFVSFFPRLVAGPILRYGEIAPQLAGTGRARRRFDDLAVGLTIFAIGLAKKSILADSIAPYANEVFRAPATGRTLDFFLAWGGALSYTFQLYFDFSGYSDMATGAARCFGIRFPMNFFSPYKASSIIEFWHRWHITLSRFLRDYLYVSLGGNRRGRLRRYLNLMATMLLGGLWHGANWTFVAWGGLHGLYLVINHAWRGITGERRRVPTRIGRSCGFLATFLAVVVAWVCFRAPDFASALAILRAMAGADGAQLPNGLAFVLRPFHAIMSAVGIGFADGSGTQLVKTYLWVFALSAIALLLPSTQELTARFDPVLESAEIAKSTRPLARWTGGLRWSMSSGWAIAGGAIAFFGIISITRVSEFLYWQF
jgi:D-alanyl-lipoteichoic acid acyltransferase DltB (MBOAT superfamily)